VTGRFALWVALLMCSCGAFRRPVGPSKEVRYRDAQILDKDPVNLIIEIDYLKGFAPKPAALRVLGKRMALYTAKKGTIEIRIDEAIPKVAWDGRRRTIKELALKYANPPADGSAYVYVMYLDAFRKFRGLSFQRGGLSAGFDHPVALVFPEKIKSILWVTRTRQEGSVIVHELGHLMGLVTDPEHYVDGHCTNSWCLMYDGLDARSIMLHALPTLLTGYLPTRFCRHCRLNMWADGVMPGRRQADRAKVRVRRAVR
jgi:hypothetical protein